MMKFELPGGVTAGLVIRSGEVELLAMKGKAVTSRVRVAIEGKEDHHLAAAVQRAVEAAKLKTKRMAVSVPSQDVLFRFFTVPVVPKAELDQVVQFEARKYVPFKMDTLVWDYCAIPSRGSAQLEVVFSAVSRDLFRQLQDVLASAGIQPVLVEPRSASLARLAEPAQGTGSDTFVCMVEVEQDSAHLAIVKNRIPYLTRDVMFSAAASPAAQPDPATPPAEPPAGNADAEPPPAGPDLKAQRLLSELSVSMNFFLREYPSTSIPRVIIFGPENVIGEWCPWLAEQLHCAVEMGSAHVDPLVDGGLPLPFAAALGLVQGARRPAGVSLDFLKRNLAKPAAAARPRAGAASSLSAVSVLDAFKTPQAAVALALAAVTLGGLWFMERVSVAAERDRLKQSAALRPEINAALSAMTKEETQALKEQAEAQLAFLKQAIDLRVGVAAKLDAVARTLPDGVWLTNLTYEDQLVASGKGEFRMSIHGACYLGETGQELGAIHRFEEQVRQNPAFFKGFTMAQVDHIDAQSDDASQQTYRAFQLNCASERRL